VQLTPSTVPSTTTGASPNRAFAFDPLDASIAVVLDGPAAPSDVIRTLVVKPATATPVPNRAFAFGSLLTSTSMLLDAPVLAEVMTIAPPTSVTVAPVTAIAAALFAAVSQFAVSVIFSDGPPSTITIRSSGAAEKSKAVNEAPVYVPADAAATIAVAVVVKRGAATTGRI
jgi:hypothetical protein